MLAPWRRRARRPRLGRYRRRGDPHVPLDRVARAAAAPRGAADRPSARDRAPEAAQAMSARTAPGEAQQATASTRLAVLLSMAMFVLVVDTSLMNVSISAVVEDL